MRYFLLLFLLSGFGATAQTQDVIVRTNGDEVPAKVLTIRPEKISYVLPATPADTLYLNTPDVFMIRYANGTKELIRVVTVESSELTQEQARAKGKQDAIMYFKAPGAFWGTFGATFVSTPIYWLGGVATGAAISASRPAPHNMVVPDPKLLQNESYVAGYQRQAQRKKLGKAAAGFGAGVGASVVAVVVLVIIALNNFQ